MFHRMVHTLQEVNLGILDMRDRDGILGLMEMVMSKIHLPMLEGYTNWGQLDSSPQGQKTKEQFMDHVDGYVNYLKSKYVHVSMPANLVEMSLFSRIDSALRSIHQN